MSWWYGNEDAGDASAYNEAEYYASKAEDAAAEVEHLVGAECDWCCAPMSEPVAHRKGVVCRECADSLDGTASCCDSREDFHADG